MATTKIITVKQRLDVCIDYAINPEKTDPAILAELGYDPHTAKNTENLFVSAINCGLDTAYEEMCATKEYWNKSGRKNQGYHVIQSFKPGEVTPEQAHAIGVELAGRILGGKHEAVVATHLDKGHLHSHIVFNSVAVDDGYMYRSTYDSYYDSIRGTSDALCREHGLSVIDSPKGKGKHYAEWSAEKEGHITYRQMLREDIDRFITISPTFKYFVVCMESAGYKVIYGENVKQMKVQPPGGERNIKLSSLKDPAYTEEGIRQRIIQQQDGPIQDNSAKSKHKSHYNFNGDFKKYKRVKLHGFKALYFKYLYTLGKVRKRQYPRRKSRLLIAETQRFNRYVSQFRFLHKNGIDTPAALQTKRANLSDAVSTLSEQRKPLYKMRKEAGDKTEKEYISAEIAELTAKLREVRRDFRTCRNMENDLPRIDEYMRQDEIESQKEAEKYERRSRRSGSGRERKYHDS